MKHKLISLLFAGHLLTDVCQGAVPALLPFFIAAYHLSYSAAGFLVLAATISSSVVQPLFGHLADRVSMPWLIAFGPLLAGLGIAFAGLSRDYHYILIGVTLCGLGAAIYHPEAARMANWASGEKKASGMSIFSVGGNAGFALGPVVTAGLVLAWGLKGMGFFLIPAFLGAALLLKAFTRQPSVSHNDPPAQEVPLTAEPNVQDAWVPFMVLVGAIVCRSVLLQGFNAFFPLYWIEVFHKSETAASTMLTVALGMGVMGNLAGGWLADRFGNKKTVLAAFVLLIPLLLAFVRLQNDLAATLLLVPIGFVMFVSFGPMIVMGQQYLPGRVGFASGITIGLAVSIGGFAAPLLGKLADHAGIHAVFYLLILFPVLSAALFFALPKDAVPEKTVLDVNKGLPG
ncbi:MFS transporter [Candidatus Formimonas warabiya]|uniref:Major facilitator superfamily (MFS) profile domain-containing protein n=1 Tax=Formimonas warabiya TaxID=1761012 RepID=A0A3G1KWR0_FORW1|nr:MFS transporter [Candidatus Formimonas warabiya]ATW26886.1 hypothetical protein DCMF_20860 [Candidatus Formimonas warabiya]